ncbi:MAG: DTW domain-containing protein, partial [Deltaproteobacteria bacterium]|nr:DTW domain-containing protein [Deltaproteobacteria bacterium]
VPDGTWAQTRRCSRREEVLARAEAVVPPDAGPTRYHLRYEHVHGGLGTGEAIARAFAVLEGPAVGDAIQRVFDLQVVRTLATRGKQLPSEFARRR